MAIDGLKNYLERKIGFDEIFNLLERYRQNAELKIIFDLLSEIRAIQFRNNNEIQKKLLTEKISLLRTELEKFLQKETAEANHIHQSLVILANYFPRNDFDEATDLPIDPISLDTLEFNNNPHKIALSDGYQFDIRSLIPSLRRLPNVNPATRKAFNERDRKLINEAAQRNDLPQPLWTPERPERVLPPRIEYRPPVMIQPLNPRPEYRRPVLPAIPEEPNRQNAMDTLPLVALFLKIAFTVLSLAIRIIKAFGNAPVERNPVRNINQPNINPQMVVLYDRLNARPFPQALPALADRAHLQRRLDDNMSFFRRNNPGWDLPAPAIPALRMRA